MKMTSDWLRSWLAFFRRNPDYKVYCLARRAGDAATCSELESKFERIAELYKDWGDIHTPEQAANDPARVKLLVASSSGQRPVIAPRDRSGDHLRSFWVEGDGRYVRPVARGA